MAFIAILLPLTALCEITPAGKQKTVMIYMCGADRESILGQGSELIKKIRENGFESKQTHVVIALGGASSWRNGYSREKIHYLKLEKEYSCMETQDSGNMAAPDTLSDFLNYCYEQVPADSYDLILWGQGGNPLQGVLFDENYGYDGLTVQELVSALKESPFANGGLGFIAFDSPMAGTLELAASLTNYADYLIASQDVLSGLSYEWVSSLREEEPASVTAQRIADETMEMDARTAPDEERAEPVPEPVHHAISVIDLNQMDAVLSATDAFFSKLLPAAEKSMLSGISKLVGASLRFGDLAVFPARSCDLFDLGDLVRHLSKSAPTEADRLFSALERAIVYRRGDRSIEKTCTGLSVYHPFRNTADMPRYLEAYARLSFSDAYAAYISRFAAFLSGETSTDWEDLEAFKQADRTENQKLIYAALSDGQGRDLAESRLQVLQLREDEGYLMLCEGQRVFPDDETNMVTGAFSTAGLFAVSKEAEILTNPVFYEKVSDDAILIPAELENNGKDESTVQAFLCCSVQDHEIKLERILLANEITGIWASLKDLPDEFDEISFTFVFKRKNWDEEDALLPFAEWLISKKETRTLPLDGSWSLQLTEKTISDQDLFGLFQLTDTRGQHHVTDTLHLGSKGQEAMPLYRKEYDGMGLVQLDEVGIMPYGGNNLVLKAVITNISDRELIFQIKNILLNGQPVEDTQMIYGTGENQGLISQEQAAATIPFISAGFSGANSNQEVIFEIAVMEASNEEILGVIPVRCKN